MTNKILVTDSLFISEEHVKQIEAVGYEVERLDKPAATEEELVEAVKGKVGYILGGTEKVTNKVIEAADELKTIVFTGTGWKGFIPGYELAVKKGIAIGAAPHMNAHAVAEFGMTMTLIMCRDAIALARGGEVIFETTKSLSECSVGIVGLGHIGTFYAQMAKGLGVKNLSYYSRSPKPDVESELGITYKDKQALLRGSDIIFVALPAEVGDDFFTAEDIETIRDGSIIVTIGEPSQFNLGALYERLANGTLRTAFDENVKDEKFRALPLHTFYTPNESTAFNTSETIKTVSDSCVATLLNILKTDEDPYRVA